MTPISPLDRDPAQRAWAAFARHDAAVTAPPGLQPRVRRSAAVLLAKRQQPQPSAVVRRRPWWPLGLAAALAAAVVAADLLDAPGSTSGAGSRLASLAARTTLPASWVASPAAAAMVPAAIALPRVSRGGPETRSVRPPSPAVAPGADPAAEAGALQVIRVRVEAAALDAFGVEVAGPIPVGLVDVDLVVGDDGWPREVRRIRPVVVQGPPD